MSDAYGKLPLSFEANRGQADAQVKFLSRGKSYTLLLTSTGGMLALHKPPVELRGQESTGWVKPGRKGVDEVSPASSESMLLRFHLLGAHPAPQVTGLDELPGKNHYFIGNDPNKWHNDVPTYARVEYKGIYPGIDLIFYGNQRQLEYDLVVAPGANSKAIRFAFEGLVGTHGHAPLQMDAQGDLVLHTAGGKLRLRKPLVYQEINGARKPIPGRYVVEGRDRVGFEVAAHDPARPLIIDPVLVYSTYLGEFNDLDFGIAVALDDEGNAYVTGQTGSAIFPIESPLQSTVGGDIDTFVTKLNPDGSALVYSTYLGGRKGDFGSGIAVDADGNAYVTGGTESTNFPIKNPLQSGLGGGRDAFVTKLNPDGSALVYSTYLGGRGGDSGLGIAVDAEGNAYVTGRTSSANFPTVPTADPNKLMRGGKIDAFVTKLNSDGSALVYSTFLGGKKDDEGHGIAVDANGNAYVTGQTSSTDFPTVSTVPTVPTAGPMQSNLGGKIDAFVAKLKPDGSALVYSRYLGGKKSDAGHSIAVDDSGNAYVTGETFSMDFPTFPTQKEDPTENVFQPHKSGGSTFSDAFVAKLDSNGSTLYSTYLGGGRGDVGRAIAKDASGNAFVTGATESANFPVQNPAQPAFGGRKDAFLAKLSPDGTHLVYSTYLGGNGSDSGRGIAVNESGSAYVTGMTDSADFPTTSGVFQRTFGGNGDAFITMIGNPRFTLTVSQAGNGKGTVTSTPAGINCGVDCVQFFDTGTAVTLTAAPGTDSLFTGWSGGCSGTNATCTVTINRAKAVTATFSKKSFSLTVGKAGTGTGTVTSNPVGINCGGDCDQFYDTGTAVTLSAVPGSDSLFTGWSGGCSGTNATCTVTINEAKAVTATFSLR